MPPWILAMAAYSALEYYLGKTDRVKQNSAIEALLVGVKSILGVFAANKKARRKK